MTDTTNQTGSILILALVTIVLAIYSLVSMRWWLENRDRLTNRLRKPWYGLFSLVSSLLAIAAIIVAPMFPLTYLMGRIKPETLGQYGAGIVLLAWCVPFGIYILIWVIRQFRRKD